MTTGKTIESNLTSPTNGQILKYNSTSHKWENQDDSGGGTTTPVVPSQPVINTTVGGDLAIYWDGKDADGDALAAGLVVQAVTLSGPLTGSAGINTGAADFDTALSSSTPSGWTDFIGTPTYATNSLSWTSGNTVSSDYDATALSAGTLTLPTDLVSFDYDHRVIAMIKATAPVYTWWLAPTGTSGALNSVFCYYDTGSAELTIYDIRDNVLQESYLMTTVNLTSDVTNYELGCGIDPHGNVLFIQHDTDANKWYLLTVWQIADFTTSPYHTVTASGLGEWGPGVIVPESTAYTSVNIYPIGDPLTAGLISSGTLSAAGQVVINAGAEGTDFTGSTLAYLRSINSAGDASAVSAAASSSFAIPDNYPPVPIVEVPLGAETGYIGGSQIGTFTATQSVLQAGVWGWKATSSVSNSLETTSFVIEPGQTYTVYAQYYTGPDAGQLGVTSEGADAGLVDTSGGPTITDNVLDCYAASATVVTGPIGQLAYNPSNLPVESSIQFETTGRNSSSTGYVMGLYRLLLVRQ
jgi:hypothetical protein